MTGDTARAGRSPMAQHLLVKQATDVAWLAAFFVAATAIVTAIVAIFTTIDTSAWEIAASIPRWFMLGWAVYAVAVYLPLYIAHGSTRREFVRRAPAFVTIMSALGGIVIALGYLLERAVYRMVDWRQEITPSLLYDSAAQVPLVAVEHTLIVAAWMLVGILVGGACYRGGGWPLAAVPAGVGTLVVIAALTAEPAVGLFGSLWSVSLFDPSVPIAMAVYTAVMAGCAALAWWVVRDLPLRARNA